MRFGQPVVLIQKGSRLGESLAEEGLGCLTVSRKPLSVREAGKPLKVAMESVEQGERIGGWQTCRTKAAGRAAPQGRVWVG